MLLGINIRGHKKIKMEDLTELYASLGFKNVRSYIQSGNIIFDSPDPNALNLIHQIEEKIGNAFGFDVVVLIRIRNEIEKLVKNNPFAEKDKNKLYVTFLSDTPAKSTLSELSKVKSKPEDFLITGREIYLFCPNGYGRSKVTNNFFEKKLKLPATTRNWKTVNKLLELAQ
jgi:uncharacterized protein (DUF1697 family)